MKRFVLSIAAGVGLLPSLASAHGIGQVYALPVPLQYYLLGAGLTVAVSFFVLSIFFNKKNAGDLVDKEVPVGWLSFIVVILKVVAVLLLLLTIATGVFGTQSALKNFAPVFFWIYFLIGGGVLSILIGNIWEKINPWKTISDWVNERQPSKQISGALGIILLLGLFWFELVSGQSFVPRAIGFALALYTLANLIGSLFYENWYKDAELFSVFFGFVGKLAHFRIGQDSKSILRVNENRKLSGNPAAWWTLGIASILLAGASFDSLKETVMWFKWLKALGFASTSMTAPTIGILLAPLPFLLLYLLAVWIMKQLVGKEYTMLDLAQRFVWSLIPIAFGYTLAHNFSLTIVTAPQMLAIVSDPFGLGWNLFGTASLAQSNLILGAKMVWFIEIGFVILAHIFGVWYAHVLATNIFKDSKAALKSQYPMMVLMVLFTIMTLWLLSQPLVVAK